jgi:hypothetical protein
VWLGLGILLTDKSGYDMLCRGSSWETQVGREISVSFNDQPAMTGKTDWRSVSLYTVSLVMRETLDVVLETRWLTG